MTTLYLDYETRSRADLRKVGAYRYARDPSTEVLMANWALDSGPVTRTVPGDAEPGAIIPVSAHRHCGFDEVENMLRDPHVEVVAHNAEFEREITRAALRVDVPPSRWRCSSAQAARHGLPRNLEGACSALALGHQKDARGKRLIQKFSKPRRPSKENPNEFWDAGSASGKWAEFEEYGADDVEAMRELHLTLPALSPTEQRVWEMTVRMNDRGLLVDRESIPLAGAAVQRATARLAARFEELTGAKPFSPKARDALGMDSLAKHPVRWMLRNTNLEPRVREALEIRQKIARTSVKKLAAFLRMTCDDGRLRGALIYSGAERTQRYSGGGVQPQNFPRGLGEGTDDAYSALRAGALDLIYGDEIQTVSEMLKGFFVGPFLIGDFAQVECRVEAWLARQADLVAAFAAGTDIYCAMAADIYGHPITKHDFDEKLRIHKRQLGKVAVLGCGYGLGAAKFQTQLDEVFDVVIDEALAEHVVQTYRERYPNIVRFWHRLERAFAYAVRHGSRRVAVCPGIFMGTLSLGGRPFAYVELPSGRALYYAYPKLGEGDSELPGCERRYVSETTVSYLGRDLHRGGQWGRVSTYGGKLTENVVQATSRDLLVDAMLRLDDASFPLALTVHDEVAAEGREVDLPEFGRHMNATPPWAAGLPHKAEVFWTERYRK